MTELNIELEPELTEPERSDSLHAYFLQSFRLKSIKNQIID
jgi:hypothetical protein